MVYVGMAGQIFALPRAPESVWAILPTDVPISLPIAKAPWRNVSPLERGIDWQLAHAPDGSFRLKYASRLIPASVWLLLEYGGPQ